MYLPPHFEERDPDEIAALIAAFPLACVVAATAEGLVANHLPVLAEGAGTLIGHVARANPMHRQIAEGGAVLAIFRGEDSYVSPNLYPGKKLHHRAVPTWNYQAVHVHGTIAFHHDERTKRAIVGRLTTAHERRVNPGAPWRMADAPADYMATMLAAIVAFRITVTGVVAKAKLSQNRDEADHAAVAADAAANGLDFMAARMARKD